MENQAPVPEMTKAEFLHFTRALLADLKLFFSNPRAVMNVEEFETQVRRFDPILADKVKAWGVAVHDVVEHIRSKG